MRAHRRLNLSLVLVLTAGMLFFASAPLALADGPNLLHNGSFDLGTTDSADPGGAPTGWHTENRYGQGGGVDLVSGGADSGTYWVDLDGSPSQGSIYQDVPTTPGHTYHITLAFSGNASCEQGQKQMAVMWNGSTIATPQFDTSTATGWVHLTYSAPASSGSVTRLELSSLTAGSCGPAVDSVSVADQSLGQTWDLTHDFPVSSDGSTPPANPAPDSYGNAGVWGIGWGVSAYSHGPAMASFRLAPSTDWENGIPSGQTAAQGWADQRPDSNHGGATPYYPYLGKNVSGGDAFGGVWPNGVVEGHPAPDGNSEDRAAVEWVSPITGTVSISASFISMNGSAGLDYSVDVKPASGGLGHVTGGYFAARGTGTYDASSVSVHAGDTYYFSVGDGNVHDYTSDSTQFSIVISSAAGGTGGSLVWHNDIRGDGTQALSHPEGVSLDTRTQPAGLIITDSGNNRLETSDPFGLAITTFDGTGTGGPPIGLSDPRQAIYSDNNFLVTDTGNNRVEVLQSGQNYDAGSFGQNVNFSLPRGIAETSDGTRIAVADAGSSSVYVLDVGGNVVLHLTGVGSAAGTLKQPEGVAFDGSNNLWVADTQNHRLVEFSPTGSVLKTISPSSSFYPTGLAVDPYSGNIWVAAWGNGNVVELDRTGQVLQTITNANGSSDPLNGPVTIAFDPSSGDLYVADTSNNRIVHYTGAGQAPVVNTDAIFSTSSTDLGVQGRVNPEGRPTTYYVQYGTSSDPSSLTQYQPAAPQSLADNSNTPYTDTSDHTVQVHLSGLTPGQSYCYRFVGFNGMGAGYGAIKCQNTVAPPTVTTDGAFSISSSDLNIKGTINPNQTPNLKYYFQLGLDQTHMNTYKPLPPPGQSVGFSDSTSHDFTADFGNLQAGTNYCFQIVATNGAATYKGGVVCHSTTGAPSVSTDSVFYQDTDRLGVQGTITPNGTPNVSYYVAYGTSQSNLNAFYPSPPGTSLGASDYSGHTVQVFVPNLKAGTQYCLQLVATDGPQTVKGGVICHATTGSPVPLLTTSTPGCSSQHCDWTETSATLSGTVNPDGAPTTWYFQYTRCPGFNYSGCPSAFHNTTSVPASPQALGDTGFSPHIVQTAVSNLQPGTTYYYRLVATNTNTGQSAYDNAHIQSVTTSQLVISAQYFDGSGTAHPFSTSSTPTFDPSGGISWSFDCSLLGQPNTSIRSCDAYYTDPNGQRGWHSGLSDYHPPLGANCTGSSGCDYTITINALDWYGQTAQAIYHYSVNPPPAPVVQQKTNTTANHAITNQTNPQQNCGIFGFVCNAAGKVVGVIQSGLNAVSTAVQGATKAAMKFLQGFGSDLAGLAQSARDFFGALFTKLSFHGHNLAFAFGFDQDADRYVAAAAGYHLEAGTVANIIGAGAGNIIGAGAGNARDSADGAHAGQSSNGQAYLASNGEPIKLIAVDNQTGKLAGIIGAGAGNALDIFDAIIGAGAGNVVANFCASFQNWFNSHIIGAGAGNIIGAGAGNIIGAGAGNIIGQKGLNIIGAGAGNIIGAGAGNIIGAGAGNAGDVTKAGAAHAAASGSVFYGGSPLTFTELAGTTVSSKIVITVLKGGHPQGQPVSLATGSTTFALTGKGTVWLIYTAAGNRLLLATGAQNAIRARKHQALEQVGFVVTDTFKPLHGKAKTYIHRYAETPTGG